MDTTKQSPRQDFGATHGAPSCFFLIVDDFGIEYVGEQHPKHIRTVLTTHYTITEDLKGKSFLA